MTQVTSTIDVSIPADGTDVTAQLLPGGCYITGVTSDPIIDTNNQKGCP